MLDHPAEAAGNRNTAKFLTAFNTGSSAAARTAALAEDEHALILARSPGKSTALHLYHNFVNFGGLWTCLEAKLAVLEGLGSLVPPFLLPALALDLASYRVPDPTTLEATTTVAEFREANAGRRINFCNTKFVVFPPWMA